MRSEYAGSSSLEVTSESLPQATSTLISRKAARLSTIRLHDVRHTYATARLANATGWHEVKVISERLGHASVGITVDRYSHVLPARDRETADTLARLILGKPGERVAIGLQWPPWLPRFRRSEAV